MVSDLCAIYAEKAGHADETKESPSFRPLPSSPSSEGLRCRRVRRRFRGVKRDDWKMNLLQNGLGVDLGAVWVNVPTNKKLL